MNANFSYVILGLVFDAFYGFMLYKKIIYL